MLSSALPLLGALSTGNKIGLATVGAIFILFALVSSFVLPRRSPDFPGKAVGWYVALGVLFFVAMISAVLVFGKEKKEATPGEPASHTSTASTSLKGQTTSTPTGATTTSGGSGGGAASGSGDAAAGKKVFVSASCNGCHTLKDAGATGNIGPNLDDLKPSLDQVKTQVINGGGGMPPFKGQLTAKQIDDVSAYVSGVAGS